jgi:hypothetical protein
MKKTPVNASVRPLLQILIDRRRNLKKRFCNAMPRVIRSELGVTLP